jgi:hypothetical protein
MTAEERRTEGVKEGPARASARKQGAMMLESLRTGLVVNDGLVVESAQVTADSIVFRLTLSDESIAMWQKAESKLGRPPILAWATVSAEASLPGEEQRTYQIRLSGFGNVGTKRRTAKIALPKRPARTSGDSPLLALPEGTDLQCSVLAVRLK